MSVEHLRCAGIIADERRLLAVRPDRQPAQVVGLGALATLMIGGVDGDIAAEGGRAGVSRLDRLAIIPIEGRVEVDGQPLRGPSPVQPGSWLRVGDTLLFIHADTPLNVDPMSAACVDALRSSSSDERWTAAQLLGTHAPQRDDVRVALDAACDDPDPRVRRWATWALTQASPSSLYLQIDAWYHPDPALRAALTNVGWLELPRGAKRPVDGASFSHGPDGCHVDCDAEWVLHRERLLTAAARPPPEAVASGDRIHLPDRDLRLCAALPTVPDAQPAPPMLWLHELEPVSPRPPRSYRVPFGHTVSIGRRVAGSPATSMSIDCRILSRRHSQITSDANGWYVEDLRSTSGTLINRSYIRERAQLHDGDELNVGAARLRVELPKRDAD